jgi:alkylation response protein AidB-like acyl-CoA dehydrogenase
VLEQLKARAKSEGLWNLWIPPDLDADGALGAGLSIQEYARLAEIMGAVPFASEVFNCSAPDTGNMEVLLKYGTPEQKVRPNTRAPRCPPPTGILARALEPVHPQERFLPPLLAGTSRSCFAMTEPAVASSDATNITSSITKDGDAYVLSGTKWWTSGAMDPRCDTCIFMGKVSQRGRRAARAAARGRWAVLGAPGHPRLDCATGCLPRRISRRQSTCSNP